MQRKWVVHCPDRPRWSPCYLTVAALLIQLARGANAAPVIQVGTVEAQPGWVVELPVTFLANGSAVAAVSHNIFFDSRYTPNAQSSAGEPECWVNPAIGKEGRFAFWPGGCWQWPETCDMVAAVILSFENTQPIPDGPLFTCRVKVSPHAPAGLHAVASDYADAANLTASNSCPSISGAESAS
ncbi:MAG: hypothetical protein N3C12_06940 [Candidatus Binatia bacterium]|nr:hypothetical protein [Candidatus Binatia bacterium]